MFCFTKDWAWDLTYARQAPCYWDIGPAWHPILLFFSSSKLPDLARLCLSHLTKEGLFVQVIFYPPLPLLIRCLGLYCTRTLEIPLTPWKLLVFEHYGTQTKSKSFVWKAENEEAARFAVERLSMVLKIWELSNLVQQDLGWGEETSHLVFLSILGWHCPGRTLQVRAASRGANSWTLAMHCTAS